MRDFSRYVNGLQSKRAIPGWAERTERVSCRNGGGLKAHVIVWFEVNDEDGEATKENLVLQ